MNRDHVYLFKRIGIPELAFYTEHHFFVNSLSEIELISYFGVSLYEFVNISEKIKPREYALIYSAYYYCLGVLDTLLIKGLFSCNLSQINGHQTSNADGQNS